jgi:hypothetical protein
MSLPHLQFRSTYPYLLALLLCAILWTVYFFSADYDVFALSRRPSFGGGGNHPPPLEVQVKGPPGGLHYIHTAIDVVIPPEVKIIGLVFFGRRELVRILDCYLKVSPPSPSPPQNPILIALTSRSEKLKRQWGPPGPSHLRSQH